MINANELRIGNWVFAGVDEDEEGNEIPTASKISQIFRDSIDWDGTYTLLEFVEPIPLTPEILEKCGFKKDKAFSGGERFQVFKHKDDLFGDKTIVPKKSRGYATWYSWHRATLTSVHQLQNLYFALTGEELKIIL